VKALWLNGWGVGSAALQKLVGTRYPEIEHICVDPVEGWIGEAYRVVDDVDWVIGYSTGAFLLLGEEKLLEQADNVMLFAPFVDFRKESGLGGKTRRVQLDYLIRMLKKEPLAALADFYQRAGLTFSPPNELPMKVGDLVWGIEVLRDVGLAKDCLGDYPFRIGSEDTLIDAKRMHELGENSSIVEGANHDLAALLDDWEGFA